METVQVFGGILLPLTEITVIDLSREVAGRAAAPEKRERARPDGELSFGTKGDLQRVAIRRGGRGVTDVARIARERILGAAGGAWDRVDSAVAVDERLDLQVG